MNFSSCLIFFFTIIESKRDIKYHVTWMTYGVIRLAVAPRICLDPSELFWENVLVKHMH